MKAPTSNRLLIFVAVTILGLTLASVLALYLLVQNKKSLPPVAQALLGGRLVHITSDGMYPTLKPGDTVAFDTRAYIDHPPKRGDIVLLIAPGAPRTFSSNASSPSHPTVCGSRTGSSSSMEHRSASPTWPRPGP